MNSVLQHIMDGFVELTDSYTERPILIRKKLISVITDNNGSTSIVIETNNTYEVMEDYTKVKEKLSV